MINHEETRWGIFLSRTKDTMVDIFETLKNNGNSLDILTDDELSKLFAIGNAICTAAEMEYEDRNEKRSWNDQNDIYVLELDYINQVLDDDIPIECCI